MPIPGVTEVAQSNADDWSVKDEPEVLTEALPESLPKKKHKKTSGEFRCDTWENRALPPEMR